MNLRGMFFILQILKTALLCKRSSMYLSLESYLAITKMNDFLKEYLVK